MARLRDLEEPHLILTLDISSTNVGYALYNLDAKKLLESGVWYSKLKDYARMLAIKDAFGEFVDFGIPGDYPECVEHRHIEVLVEQPFYIPGKSNDLPIKMMHGMLLSCMHSCSRVCRPPYSYSWNYVNVSTWRSKILKGRPKSEEAKKAVKRAMQRYWKVAVKDDNQGDALGILYWRLKYGT